MADVLYGVIAWIPGFVRDVESWLAAYDVAANRATFWLLALCFSVVGITKLISWSAIRDQQDKTSMGFALKRKKLSEAVASFAMAFLYYATLYAHYSEYEFSVWGKLLARVIAGAGMVGAVIWGLRFIAALRRERGEVHE